MIELIQLTKQTMIYHWFCLVFLFIK